MTRVLAINIAIFVLWIYSMTHCDSAHSKNANHQGLEEVSEFVREGNNKKSSQKRYPKLPKNLDKITEGDEYEMCSTFDVSSIDINFRRFISNIEEYYGDKNEFFNKYILSLGCSPGYMSFSDRFLKGSRSLLMTMFTNYTKKFGKFDRNAFIRIKRDGVIYEGPLQFVFSKLHEKFPDNKEYRHILGMSRIPVFFKGEMRTCQQMQSDDSDFPCQIP